MNGFNTGEIYYFKFIAGGLDIDARFEVNCNAPHTFKYRVNNGSWITDTTVGAMTSFGVDNAQHYFIKLRDNTRTYYNADDIIEIYCFVDATYPSGNPNLPNYIYLLNRSIENPIEMVFYQYTNEKDLVTKTTYLTSTLLEYGQFTEEVDILNPSFIIQLDSFIYNYFYIPQFSRYYFVTNITSLRKGLWRISGHVDVLYSYDSDIRKQYGYIVRNERNPYGLVLPDERVSFFAEPSYTFTDVTGGTLANTSLDVNQNDVTAFTIVLSVLNENARVVYSSSTQPTGTTLPSIYSTNYQNALAYNYALTSSTFSNAMLEVSQNQTLESFIFGAWVYPFRLNKTIDSLIPLPVVTYPMKIGTTTLSTSGSLMAYDLSPYLIVADFTLPSYTSFEDIEPYTYCDLYIPYYSGIFHFDLQRCAGHDIIVYYTTQFSNGNSFVYVYDYTDNQLLLNAPVQLAQQLSISTTNAFEINQQRALSHIGYAGNTMNALAKMIGSAIGENAIGIITAGQKWMGDTIRWAFGQSLMKDTANIGISSANGGYFNPQKVYLITKKRQENIADLQTFETRNGYPINTWDYLSTTGYEYTGYTEMTQIHYHSVDLDYITSPEIDEIETLAKNGIIL